MVVRCWLLGVRCSLHIQVVPCLLVVGVCCALFVICVSLLVVRCLPLFGVCGKLFCGFGVRCVFVYCSLCV